jgi:heptosyltransferase I
MSRRFLISRLSSLGDVVCSLPAATALKAGIPEAHLTWVVDERFADIVRCCSAVDEIVLRSDPLPSKPFEAALDLQGLLKSSLIVAKVKADKKLGYHWQREGSSLFSRRVLPDPSSLHVVDQYVDVARAAGGEADRADFAMRPEPSALPSVSAKLGSTREYVVVNPGAAWAAKRWPAEHIAQFVDALEIPVVLIGSKGEAGAEEVMGLCKSTPINLTGQTTIVELIALLSLARAHVGGDTGSTHIAAALGVPAIGLYASTRPERTCPYGQIHRCHYDPRGLDRISPEVVLKTVKEAIA